jgi:hypothetical protein
MLSNNRASVDIGASLPAVLASLNELSASAATLAQVLAKHRDAALGTPDHSALHRMHLALCELATSMSQNKPPIRFRALNKGPL